MTDYMDATMNKATFSLLAVAIVVMAAIAAKVHTLVDAQAPEGYEDESGFHFGTPTFRS
jgi:hypothetical protein